MNINIVSDADDFLNGNIQFIAEVFLDAKQNPFITIRKNADGILGLHLSGWDCKESIEVYNENAIDELREALLQAATFLQNMKYESKDGQMNLFEEIDIVRKN